MAEPAIFSELALLELQEDNIEEGPIYFITWNPKPKFYNYDKYGDNDYNYQWYKMLEVLQNISRCASKFALVPEIGEQGKLHCHGWFHLKDKVKYHKSFLPLLRRNGFIKIDKIKQINDKTFKYYKKDIADTKLFLTDYDIIVYTPHVHTSLTKVLKCITNRYLLKEINKEIEEEKEVRRMDIMKMLRMHNMLHEGGSDEESIDSDN